MLKLELLFGGGIPWRAVDDKTHPPNRICLSSVPPIQPSFVVKMWGFANASAPNFYYHYAPLPEQRQNTSGIHPPPESDHAVHRTQRAIVVQVMRLHLAAN